MSEKPKSVIDNVPVVNSAFRSFPDYVAAWPPTPTQMIVVSKCAKCGNPIYGPCSINSDTVAQVTRTCGCVYMPKFTETMQTK